MNKVLVFLFIIFCNAALTQNQRIIDSLSIELRRADTPEKKHEVISEMFYETVSSVPTAARIYAEMEMELYNATKDSYYHSVSLNMKGSIYYLISNYDSALFYFNKKVAVDLSTGDTNASVGTLFNVSMIHSDMGNYELALETMKSVLELDIALKDTASIIADYDAIGLQYQRMKDYTTAEKYYMTGYDLMMASGNFENFVILMVDLSNMYREQYDYEKGLDFLQKAYPAIIKRGDKQALYTLKNNSALIYDEMGEKEKAIRTHLDALKIGEESGMPALKATSYNNLGFMYMNLEMPDSAIYYLILALEIKRETASAESLCLTLSNLGNSYAKKDMHNKAIEYFDEAIQIATSENLREPYAACKLFRAASLIELGNFKEALAESQEAVIISDQYNFVGSRIEGREILAKAYAGVSNYKSAYLTYIEYHEIADSIINVDKVNALANADVKFESELKEKQIELLGEQNKLKDAEISKEQEINKRKQLLIYAGIIGIAFVFLLGLLIYRAYHQGKKSNKQLAEKNEVIQLQKEKVENQHEQLVEKNKEILDSITYAKRIQSAILPPSKLVKEYLAQSFILYMPKDIVAGDFYWMEQKNGNILFAAADCTGHGVPGAMVSVICNNGLNRSVREYGLTDPGEILNKTREIVIQEFEKSEEEVRDGMDIALCSLNGTNLKFAGANNPLWIIRKNSSEIEEIKADKQPIGKYGHSKPFVTQSTQINPGDSFYIFTDGFQDQFGGEKGKKFKASNLKSLLLSVQNESMETQKQIIEDAFETWRGKLEQLDDVCVIGVKI